MNVAAHPIAPRRPLLELLLRTRGGVSHYRAVPLGANQPADISPAGEANLWIHQSIANHPLMQHYLSTIPPDSRSFAINRAVDYVRDLLYRTLEPWRIGARWRDFEEYADHLVGVACWVAVTLNDDPCVT